MASIDRGIALQGREVKPCALSKAIDQFHRRNALGRETHTDLAERCVALARGGPHPLQCPLVWFIGEGKGLEDLDIACKQRSRSCPQRLIELAPGDLVQFRIVEPQCLTVAHNRLWVGFQVHPAKTPWSGELERAV